jgi:NAD(P)-dependent dehydrogenase (short-subunit alcohol dehydrogenase family)
MLKLGKVDSLKIDGWTALRHRPSLDCFAFRLKAGVPAMDEPRTAIVTGAGRRVGAEIAKALLNDGWTVLAHVHHGEDAVPEGAVKVVADLAEAGCADKIFAAAGDFPPVRLLVNNAARFAWDGFGEFRGEEFDAHMAVNVRAPALLIDRFAAQHDDGDALIVNLLDSKLSAPNPDYLSYTLSKSALAALTELAARALARRRIRVNGIAPALMLRSSGQSQENFAAMHARNPLGRGVEPDDVVAAVLYLWEARAVTGQVITIDSGHRFLGIERDVQFL